MLVFGIALSLMLFSEGYKGEFASAANTLNGINEVITIGGTTDGQPVNSSIGVIDYSGDGNIILFGSSATNLPDAGGSAGGLYVYNIKDETVKRVDISTNGTLPNANPFQGGGGDEGPAQYLSESGRYVTFASVATNLIDGTTTGKYNIYKRDTQTDTTTLVGRGVTDYTNSDEWDRNLGVSNDGRFYLITTKFLDTDYPKSYDVKLYDINKSPSDWQKIKVGKVGDLSCDGAFVVGGDKLYDLRNSTPVEIASGFQGSPIISCNGRYVLYATNNRTLISPTPTGMDSYLHLARYDRLTGERIYIDSDSSNVFSTGAYTWNPTYLDFNSNKFSASIADSGDVVFKYKYGGQAYAYIKHLSDGSGTLEPIAKTMSGSYINVSDGVITSNGKYVFFKAEPYDLGIGSSPQGVQLIRAKTNL